MCSDSESIVKLKYLRDIYIESRGPWAMATQVQRGASKSTSDSK